MGAILHTRPIGLGVATTSLVCLATLTPAAGITATPSPTMIVRSVAGTVLAPGVAGLEPVAGIEVEAIACSVSVCLGESGTGTTTETSPTGQFSLAIPADVAVIRAAIGGDVLRVLVYQNGPVTIDPISEATVQLFAERELGAYPRAQLPGIEAEVRRANASADFAGLTVADAVALALANARADAAVETALAVWTPTPTSTSTASRTETPTPTRYAAMATATRRPCVGDCDHSMSVTVNELVTGVGILLETADPELCTAFDDPQVSDLVEAVGNALGECMPPPGLPDLAIDNDQALYVLTESCPGGEFCGRACIVNIGNADASAFDTLLGGIRVALPGLASGEGQCLRVCDNLIQFMGAVVVDANGAVEELDEDNNDFVFSYPTPTPGGCR